MEPSGTCPVIQGRDEGIGKERFQRTGNCLLLLLCFPSQGEVLNPQYRFNDEVQKSLELRVRSLRHPYDPSPPSTSIRVGPMGELIAVNEAEYTRFRERATSYRRNSGRSFYVCVFVDCRVVLEMAVK